MWEEEEVAWGTREGRRWHGNTTVVMLKVVEKKNGWSKRLSRGRGERHCENKSNRRPTLKRWFRNIKFHYPCCSAHCRQIDLLVALYDRDMKTIQLCTLGR